MCTLQGEKNRKEKHIQVNKSETRKVSKVSTGQSFVPAQDYDAGRCLAASSVISLNSQAPPTLAGKCVTVAPLPGLLGPD